MKQNHLASLKNTDTGESWVVVYVARLSLSLLERVFDDFGMEILKKAHEFFTKQSCSACLCIKFSLWREACGGSLNESSNAVEQRSVFWNSFVKLACFLLNLASALAGPYGATES